MIVLTCQMGNTNTNSYEEENELDEEGEMQEDMENYEDDEDYDQEKDINENMREEDLRLYHLI